MFHAICRAVLFSSVLLVGCEREPVLETSANQLAPSIRSRVAGFDSWIEIDLDGMGRNLERIRERTGAEVMPVVKNNAYGHGLVPVVRYLMSQGVTRVFVAKFQEALQIREAGLDCKIVNMGPLFTDDQYRRAVELGITQTVFTEEAAQGLSRAALELGTDAGVFVKVDTGLRRVGVLYDRAADFIEEAASLPGVRIEGIFSTFVQTREQDEVMLARFLEVDAELTKRGIEHGVRSMASSDAIFHFPEAYMDLVRPGMSLYGVYPESKDVGVGLELEQVLTMKARVELVKWIEEGDSVTYWGRFIAPKKMMVGTVHAGFFDGLPRELANKGKVFYQGELRDMLGSISLNHIVIDLTGTDARAGDAVEIIGRQPGNTVNDIATSSGWMVYSLFNHLNARTPRVYYENGEAVELLEF
ncbi:MAG: alanine racemase [Acidobacteriota bacterium]|nr:MAG: alanine racemase [Acidobacteriota bacterium]